MRNKYNIKDGSKVFLLALFLPQVISILLVTILSCFFTAEQLQNSNAYIVAMMLVTQFSFFLIFVFYNKYRSIDCVKECGLKTKVSAKNVLLAILISFIAVAGFINFVGVFAKLVGLMGFKEGGRSIPINTPAWLIVNVVITAVIPAFFEEIIFRGMIFNGLKKCGLFVAVALSSLFFMLEHLSLYSFVYPIIMGIVFCLIYNKTKSIVYTMITHFCNNFIVILIDYFNETTNNNFGMFDIKTWWGVILSLLVAGVAFVAIFFIVKKFMLCAMQDDSEQQENQEVVIVNDENEQINNNISSHEALQDNKKSKYFLLTTSLISFAFWLLVIISVK